MTRSRSSRGRCRGTRARAQARRCPCIRARPATRPSTLQVQDQTVSRCVTDGEKQSGPARRWRNHSGSRPQAAAWLCLHASQDGDGAQLRRYGPCGRGPEPSPSGRHSGRSAMHSSCRHGPSTTGRYLSQCRCRPVRTGAMPPAASSRCWRTHRPLRTRSRPPWAGVGLGRTAGWPLAAGSCAGATAGRCARSVVAHWIWAAMGWRRAWPPDRVPPVVSALAGLRASMPAGHSS